MELTLTQIHFGATILLFLIVLWQAFKIYRLDSVRKHFYSMGLKKNLETIVTEQDQGIAELVAAVADLNQQTESLRVANLNNFQKLGFVRFSQHGEAGNLSFAFVLLNAHDTGIAISSLHSREGVRIYSKDIVNGKSKAKLTDEETQALTQALNGKE
ncbi:MAG: DUF4446 family protein [Candidatus Doudnabacteria bacterium]|nr:DUF4446 family protein [Candidatus Doudnabacteria bacterium]